MDKLSKINSCIMYTEKKFTDETNFVSSILDLPRKKFYRNTEFKIDDTKKENTPFVVLKFSKKFLANFS